MQITDDENVTQSSAFINSITKQKPPFLL